MRNRVIISLIMIVLIFVHMTACARSTEPIEKSKLTSYAQSKGYYVETVPEYLDENISDVTIVYDTLDDDYTAASLWTCESFDDARDIFLALISIYEPDFDEYVSDGYVFKVLEEDGTETARFFLRGNTVLLLEGNSYAISDFMKGLGIR